MDSGRRVYGRGGDPSPIPYAPKIVQKTPEIAQEAAQSRNEDGIKISIRTVQLLVSHRNKITSESVLHRIARPIVRNRTFAIVQAGAYHQLHDRIPLLPVLFAAHRGIGNL